MYKLIHFALLASGALAATHYPALIARQSTDCDEINGDPCPGGTGCIPAGYTCCEGGGGCAPGTYCDGGGCCDEGEICTGPGGSHTDTFTLTDETTSTAVPPASSSVPVIPTSSAAPIPSVTPSSSVPTVDTPTDSSSASTPSFTGGVAALNPGFNALAGLVAGAVLL